MCMGTFIVVYDSRYEVQPSKNVLCCFTIWFSYLSSVTSISFILFSAKYGTPNRKMELLFQLVPQLRRLGYLHYAMMTKPTLGIFTPKSKEVWSENIIHAFLTKARCTCEVGWFCCQAGVSKHCFSVLKNVKVSCSADNSEFFHKQDRLLVHSKPSIYKWVHSFIPKSGSFSMNPFCALFIYWIVLTLSLILSQIIISWVRL